ncbi:MAG: hypothetical protein LBD02_09085 [Christensenellaceae bacterium]|jgi:hypothetical protein|nr:hypothetical protein [Christensenellaceae bacterium]
MRKKNPALPLALALLLCFSLSGCALLPAGSSESAFAKNLGGGVGQALRQSLTRKLSPVSESYESLFSLDALADGPARALLGQELEALDGAAPYLRQLAQKALGEGRALDLRDGVPGGGELLGRLLSADHGFFAQSAAIKNSPDGRLFIENGLLAALRVLFGDEEPAGLFDLEQDEKNGGLLFLPNQSPRLLLRLLSARGAFPGQTAGEVRLEFELSAKGDALGFVFIDVLADEGSPFGLRALRVEPFPGETRPDIHFLTDGAATGGAGERQAYPGLGLSLMRPESLLAEEQGGALSLSILPKGVHRVARGGPGRSGGEPRATLTILSALGEGFRPEDSAYASAEAAQKGYAAQGAALYGLSIAQTPFLGQSDAFLLSYEASDGAALRQSVRHYILKGPNRRLYHFVFLYSRGATEEERDLLQKAAASLRFL